MTVKFFTDGEEDIRQGDIATCSVKLERLNIDEGSAAGFVHSPQFPVNKYEEWFVFIRETSAEEIVGYQRVQATTRHAEAKIMLPIPASMEAGTKTYVVFAMCDSYNGLDTMEKVEIEVLEGTNPSSIPLFIHPEDAALDDQS